MVKQQKHYKNRGFRGQRPNKTSTPPKICVWFDKVATQIFWRREQGGHLINSPFSPGLLSSLMFIIFSDLPSLSSLSLSLSLYLFLLFYFCFVLSSSSSRSLSLSLSLPLFFSLIFYVYGSKKILNRSREY